MALTPDQKKHLLIGGGVSAAALIVGYLFGRGRKTHEAGYGHHRHGHAMVEVEHEHHQRGEYGHHRHKHHHGGD